MIKRLPLLVIILLAILAFSFQYFFGFSSEANETFSGTLGQMDLHSETAPPEKKDRVLPIEIVEGATFAKLLTDMASTTYSQAIEIYDASLPVYDLTKIRQGKIIELIYDKDDDSLKELRYKVDTEDELFVRLVEDASSAKFWLAEIVKIPYEVKEKIAHGVVESSMYQAALDNDIDIRAIIELANAFQWSIDFAMDPRVGDEFTFVYEERYLEGEYVMPGRVFAGKYVNAGKDLYTYYFEESDDNKGFFDEDGNSAQKMFLKAPLEFRYISSGFTTGLRYIEAFNVSTGHRAIDYAASVGTPIRAVGDGTITFAGWNSGGYGNLIKMRHNGTYSTNYAHLSKFAVKTGQRVKQGDIIGYVGSTGFSTGPHLHYEMVKNGVKVNPLAEVLPPGEPIREDNRTRFFELKDIYNQKLNSL